MGTLNVQDVFSKQQAVTWPCASLLADFLEIWGVVAGVTASRCHETERKGTPDGRRCGQRSEI